MAMLHVKSIERITARMMKAWEACDEVHFQAEMLGFEPFQASFSPKQLDFGVHGSFSSTQQQLGYPAIGFQAFQVVR